MEKIKILCMFFLDIDKLHSFARALENEESYNMQKGHGF